MWQNQMLLFLDVFFFSIYIGLALEHSVLNSICLDTVFISVGEMGSEHRDDTKPSISGKRLKKSNAG